MDKNTKFQPSSAKGIPADAKKNQDVSNNKLLPKTSRRREPTLGTGASNSSKHEPPKKANAQKAKSFDKRPKPKGQYHGGAKKDTKVGEEYPAEPGSVMAQGSKKQNLNHLLNFHYAPRDVQGGSSMWNYGKSAKGYNRNSNRWLPPVQRHKYNKEQFLQASCQFVVTSNGNYAQHLIDPDILVDWKLVEQIKVHSSDSLSCPICLCTPVAGKMTRCGHVYCWPCILHYLSLSDKSWRNCPICYDSVQKSDLKSVMEVTHNNLNLGESVTLRLMRREKGSLLAVPVGSENPTNFLPVSQSINESIYSKLLIANISDVMNIIEWERTLLKMELMDNAGSPENCFIDQALNELDKREEELLEKNPSTSIEAPLASAIETPTLIAPKKEEKNDDENEAIEADIEPDMKPMETLSATSPTTAGSPKFFYFYQADDGQHVYLHGVNVKMLEKQYGSLENSPHVITGKLLEKEGTSLTDELRRRLRYLCHLPITCPFEIAEIELKPPIVSEEVLSSFHDQLALREKRRQRRDREEQKREKKITEEENKRMGRYPTPNVHIDSQRHFPEWQPELLYAEDNTPTTPPESAAPSSVASSPPLSTFEEAVASREVASSHDHEKSHDQGPSFAEMLRKKGSRFKSNSGWPSMNLAKSSSNAAGRSSSPDTDNENYTSVPSHTQLCDALARALERSRFQETDTDGGGKGKKKKKKNKPTVLFSTTMPRPL